MNTHQVPTQRRDIKDNTNLDVAPDWLIRSLMIAWIVLLGGRWIATPFLMFGDPSLSHFVSVLDRDLLLRCYLVLLSVTVMIPALRFARSIEQRGSKSPAGENAR